MASHPLHLHFGAGKLGIGAVLPALTPNRNLIVVQVKRNDWDSFEHFQAVRFCAEPNPHLNPEGTVVKPGPLYNQVFQCQRITQGLSRNRLQSILTGGSFPKLLLVDKILDVLPLINLATSISCSMGDGQKSLASVLALDNGPIRPSCPVLAFENTVTIELHSSRWTVLHTITDRICTHRTFHPNEKLVKVNCEPYLSFIAEESCQGCFSPAVAGAHVRFVPQSHLAFHAKRKRAIVNSLHQVLALCCAKALYDARIRADSQYLPLVWRWFVTEHPSLSKCIDAYIKLRSLELTWPLIIGNAESSEHSDDRTAAVAFYNSNVPQLVYDSILRDANLVIERFHSQPDLISRLVTHYLTKEVSKYSEHIVGPFRWITDNAVQISKAPIFDKPSPFSIDTLKAFFEDCFAVLGKHG